MAQRVASADERVASLRAVQAEEPVVGRTAAGQSVTSQANADKNKNLNNRLYNIITELFLCLCVPGTV